MLTHRPRIRFGLQARITLETVIGLTAIFFVMGYVGRRGLANSTQVALEQRLALAQLVASYVDDHAGHVMGALSDAAAEYDVRLDDADPAPEAAMLADAYRSGYFLQMILTDSRGVVLAVWPQAPTSAAPTEVGEDLSGLPHVQRALASGEAQVSNVIAGVGDDPALVMFVLPLRSAGGQVVGTIGGWLDPITGSGLSTLIMPLALGETGYAQVLDAHGVVVASTHAGETGRPSEHTDLMPALLRESQPALAPDSLVWEDGQEVHEVIAFAPIPRLGWGVAVEQERGEALAAINRISSQIVMVSVPAVLVAVLFVWRSTRRITRPTLALAEAARRMAEGDLAAPLPPAGPDELGQLIADFAAMRDRLRHLLEAQARWAAELEGRVAERTRQLVDLQRATHRLTADLSLEATHEAMAEESLRLFGADRSATFVLDPASGELACPIRHGLSAEYVEAVRQNFMHAAGGVALSTAKPVAVPDARGDPRMAPLADFVAREGFCSLLILPMVYRGRVTGAFALYHDRPRDYSPEEISLGEAFAAQAASAVANARLYAELQQRVAELERFNRLAVGRELKMRELKDRLRSLESTGEARE